MKSSLIKENTVSERVQIEYNQGKKLYFDVVAKMGEETIGEGTHLRFIVNKERFLNKL